MLSLCCQVLSLLGDETWLIVRMREEGVDIGHISLLAGETVKEAWKTTDGVLAFTNYRLYIDNAAAVVCNLPLTAVENVYVEKMTLVFLIKTGATYRCSMDSIEKLQLLVEILNKAINPKRIEDYFAFHYFRDSLSQEKAQKTQMQHKTLHDQIAPYNMEFSRLQFDREYWRISRVNDSYTLCDSYPPALIMPRDVGDNDLKSVAEFRTRNRIPAVVWRHRENGSVIVRSSQPLTGLLSSRSPQDENLIRQIRASCARDSAQPERERDPDWKMLIMDARGTISVMYNRITGGGNEYGSNYPDTESEYMGLPNIHSVRTSLHSIRNMGLTEEWRTYLSKLLIAAVRLCEAVDRDSIPVLVHCSDGWDRTPQIVSLALLMLDPFYRTVAGFRVLFEREWRDFGHKFGDRCGNVPSSSDLNERSPIFLQWLDAVHQLLRQFPTSFEFVEGYLQKMAVHCYSGLYGTFLCNSARQRLENSVHNNTFAVWPLLRDPKYLNVLYQPDNKLLTPTFQMTDIVVWDNVFNPPPTPFPLVEENPEVQTVEQTAGNLAPCVHPACAHAVSCKTENDEHECPSPGEFYSDMDGYENVPRSFKVSNSVSSTLPESPRKRRTISEELYDRYAGPLCDDDLPTDETDAPEMPRFCPIIPEERMLGECGIVKVPRRVKVPKKTVTKRSFDQEADGLVPVHEDVVMKQCRKLVSALHAQVHAQAKQLERNRPKAYVSNSAQCVPSFRCLSCGEVVNVYLDKKSSLVCLRCSSKVCASCSSENPVLPAQRLICRLCFEPLSELPNSDMWAQVEPCYFSEDDVDILDENADSPEEKHVHECHPVPVQNGRVPSGCETVAERAREAETQSCDPDDVNDTVDPQPVINDTENENVTVNGHEFSLSTNGSLTNGDLDMCGRVQHLSENGSVAQVHVTIVTDGDTVAETVGNCLKQFQ